MAALMLNPTVKYVLILVLYNKRVPGRNISNSAKTMHGIQVAQCESFYTPRKKYRRLGNVIYTRMLHTTKMNKIWIPKGSLSKPFWKLRTLNDSETVRH